MKHGHVSGRKNERKQGQAEAARLQQMGKEIAAQFHGRTAAEILAMALQPLK